MTNTKDENANMNLLSYFIKSSVERIYFNSLLLHSNKLYIG